MVVHPAAAVTQSTTTTTTTPNQNQSVPMMLTPAALNGGGNPASNYVPPSSGDPVNDETGDFYQTYTDASIPGRGPALDLTRTYNSDDASGSLDGSSPFGNGWSSSYSMQLLYPGPDATLVEENGATVAFDGYGAPEGAYATLTYNSTSNTYSVVRKETQTFVFNSSGQLISESDPNGYTTTLSYTSGRLSTVTDPEGRTLTLAYGSNGLISSVTDPLSRVTSYGYNSSNLLSSVTDPMGRVTTFTYNGTPELVTITDPNGGTTTNTYGSVDFIASQTDPMGLETTYSFVQDDGTVEAATITDPHGSVTEESFDAGSGFTEKIVGYGTPSAATTRYDDEGDGETYETTDPNGHNTYTDYTSDNTGTVISSTDGVGNVTNYGSNGLDEQTEVGDPAGTNTSDNYDADGNLLSKTVEGPYATPTWSDTAYPGSSFTAISCSSTAFCMAADSSSVWTTTNPTASTPTWSSSALPFPIGGLSCPTTTLCMASGTYEGYATVEITTNPTASSPTWSSSLVQTDYGVTAVSCAATTFCLAANTDGVWVSTNPTATSPTWSGFANLPGAFGYSNPFTGLSCPTTSFCEGIAGDAYSLDPLDLVFNAATSSAWADEWNPSSGVMQTTSCPTMGLCLASSRYSGSGLYATSDPTAWSPTVSSSFAPESDGFGALSCPTISFCMASDGTYVWRTTTDMVPLVATTTYTYGDSHAGDVTQVSDPAGHVTNYSYDSYGDVATTTTNPASGVTDVTEDVYDEDGEKVCEASPSAVAHGINCPSAGSARVAGTTTSTYDADGEVLTETDPLGNVTTTAYDNDGNAIASVDPLGNVTTATYDADSRVVSTMDPPLTSTPVQQSSGASVSGSTETVTLPSNVTAGDGLTLSFDNVFDSKTVTSVSGGGGTWVKANQENNSSASADNEIWYLADSTGGSGTTSITLTLSGTAADTYAANVTEWQGALNLDAAPSGTTGTGTTLSAPSITPTHPNEIVVAGGGTRSPTAIAAVGTLAANAATGLTTLAVNPQHVGDVIALTTLTWSPSTYPSSISGGGVTTWTKAVDYPVTGYGYDAQIWYGKVTTTGSSTITVSYPASVSSDWIEFTAQEFSSTAGSGTTWGVDHTGTQANGSSTTMTYPSLSPSGAGELYYGYADGMGGIASAGSTSGFTYDTTPAENEVAYDTNVSSPSTYQPTTPQAAAGPSLAVAVTFTATASGGSLGGGFSALTLHGTNAGSGGLDAVTGYLNTSGTGAVQMTQGLAASVPWSGTTALFTHGDATYNGYDLVPSSGGPCLSSVSGATFCTTTTNGNDQMTVNYFNANNNEIEIVAPGGHTATFTYDGVGNQLTKTTAAGTTTDAYDDDNRVTSVTYSAASGYTAPHSVSYMYDADGRRTQMVDGTGTSTYTYDGLGRLTSTTNGAASTVSYGYDLDNEATSITYPGTSPGTITAVGTTVSAYAAADTTLAVDPVHVGDALVLSTMAYSGSESITAVSGGGSTWHKMTSTVNGYVEEELWLGTVTTTGSSTITVTYSSSLGSTYAELDAQEFESSTGASTTWGTDVVGHLSNSSSTTMAFPTLTPTGTGELYAGFAQAGTTAGTGSTSGFTYFDTDGTNAFIYNPSVSSAVSPTASQSPAGTSTTLGALITATGSGGGTATYAYDGAGDMKSVSDFQGRTTNFSYSNTSSSSGPGFATTYANGTTATASADADGNEVALSATSPTLGISYTRNADESVTGENVSVAGSTWYSLGDGYDPDTQVTSTTASGLTGAAGSFGYDAAANPTSLGSATQAFNSSEELTSATVSGTTTAYAYDSFGDRASATVGSASPSTYSYSQVGQLTGATPSGGSAYTYAYNGDGLRMSKTTGATTESYTYDTLGSVPLLLVDGSTDYIYGPGGTVEQEVASTPLYYVADALGSTQWLLNQSGSAVGSYAYSTYGTTLSHTGASSTPIGYAGYYTDAETGFLYLVNRYYDPVTGEFITVDPLYGGTSNPPATGPGAGSSSQPVSVYQLVLGAPAGVQFNGGDPAAGLNVSVADTNTDNFDTTGAVNVPGAFGLSDLALASLSSINGLPETNPGSPNPSYVGAGFFSPNSVSSSGSPYAYVGGDPVDGVDPDGESPWGWVYHRVVQPTYHFVVKGLKHPLFGPSLFTNEGWQECLAGAGQAVTDEVQQAAAYGLVWYITQWIPGVGWDGIIGIGTGANAVYGCAQG
jgi:RHS repeat-associated protein